MGIYEWRFLDYVDGESNPIREWLNDRHIVPVKAKAKIQRILLQLAGTPFWTRPLASNLDGYPGIVEIRVRWMNTQYRILGYRGPRDREFTLLFPAMEKGDQFVPPSAPQVAENRMAIVNNDWRRAVDHRFN
jgi:hypothetical protein